MSLTIYDTRATLQWSRLDEAHFDDLNAAGNDALELVCSGCIDAPGQMPAGGMRAYVDGWTEQQLVNRADMTPRAEEVARRQALAKRLIAEILAEEAGR